MVRYPRVWQGPVLRKGWPAPAGLENLGRSARRRVAVGLGAVVVLSEGHTIRIHRFISGGGVDHRLIERRRVHGVNALFGRGLRIQLGLRVAQGVDAWFTRSWRWASSSLGEVAGTITGSRRKSSSLSLSRLEPRRWSAASYQVLSTDKEGTFFQIMSRFVT